MSECPSCLAQSHLGRCVRDPDQVKAERHRREVGALTRRVAELEAEAEALREIARLARSEARHPVDGGSEAMWEALYGEETSP